MKKSNIRICDQQNGCTEWGDRVKCWIWEDYACGETQLKQAGGFYEIRIDSSPWV